ncbi:MAG TPA: hypothetical protein VLV81_04080 [Acidimicrobiia bacterium]|nr:hypothetical protein [Acidimicrobiia bacterium]
MISGFYQAFAPTSFTLLGLWLIVVQTRHAEWRANQAQRRRTYAITLQFALPGLMSLLALVDVASQDVWRVSFATVAIIGAAALAWISRWGRIGTGMNLVVNGATLVAAALYALIAVIALHPAVVSNLGVSLTPLQCEAILLSILVFLAVNLAWFLMFEELPDAP